MSYCVHCGVQLADYEKSCPLCGTPVLDPHRTEAKDEPLFIDRMELTGRQINRTFIATLIFVLLLIPFAVTAILDLLLSVELTWAFYVLGAETCIGVFVLFPLLFPSASPYLIVVIDTAAVCAYLTLINILTGAGNWLLLLALPLTLLVGWMAFLDIFIIRRKRIGKLAMTGWLFLALSAFLVGIDVIVAQYMTGSFLPKWSFYASAPLLVLSVVILIFSRSYRITDWIRRKLFM